jgi:hypothetical protein
MRYDAATGLPIAIPVRDITRKRSRSFYYLGLILPVPVVISIVGLVVTFALPSSLRKIDPEKKALALLTAYLDSWRASPNRSGDQFAAQHPEMAQASQIDPEKLRTASLLDQARHLGLGRCGLEEFRSALKQERLAKYEITGPQPGNGPGEYRFTAVLTLTTGIPIAPTTIRIINYTVTQFPDNSLFAGKWNIEER